MLQSIHVIIPFKAREGKSRLSSALKPAERRLFAFAMLRDVLSAVFGQGRTTILSTQELRAEDLGIDVEILPSELELNDALNSLISHQADLDWPADILIVMADLPLLREKEKKRDSQLPRRCCPLSGTGRRDKYDPHSQPEIPDMLSWPELS